MNKDIRLNKQQALVSNKLILMGALVDQYRYKRDALKDFITQTHLSYRQSLRYYRAVKEGKRYIDGGHKYRINKNKCYFCQIDYNLHIHHVDKDKSNNNKDNLLILCSGCHARLHVIYNKIWGLK